MGSLEGLRVMLAEDDVFIAGGLAEILANHGAIVATCMSVGELMQYSPRDFDVALLDYGLNDGEVNEAVVRFRQAMVPVVYQSGREPEEIRDRHPDDVFLQKPVSEELLVSVLAKYQR